eukprot:CAMPEP_0202731910 /NCGR_PEP_ID=MMETSP1385-20130828/187388_1 /ASSEMBLY_ACC=CAM_ASM_000861 /TAXON_ID=933848 /ORGANISM="Elphidium margaritaceum" /LENGTH=414 /DNA_ID=CAMNT_0049398213 /DNA_START=1102 /DNA_END=2346 /DNA_ORIENTATION=+
MSSKRLHNNGIQRRETDVERASSANIKELTLYDCLEDKYGFYALLTHAFKEYSVENVLAVVELHQFQTYFGGKQRDKRSLDYVSRKTRADRDRKAKLSSALSLSQPQPHNSGAQQSNTLKPIAINVEMQCEPSPAQWLGNSKQQSVPSESAYTHTTSPQQAGTPVLPQHTSITVTEELDLTRKPTPNAHSECGTGAVDVADNDRAFIANPNLSISAISVDRDVGDEQKSSSPAPMTPVTPGGSKIMETLKVTSACSASAARRKRRNQRHSGQRSVMEDLQNVQVQNHWFALPDSLPPSTIVHDPRLSMREKIVQLIDKYIERSGKYELNIGATHRSNLLSQKQRLDEVDDDDCAAIFNQTIYAVIALMHDSFIRFQKTHSYEQLRKMLATSKDKEDTKKRRSILAIGSKPNTLL